MDKKIQEIRNKNEQVKTMFSKYEIPNVEWENSTFQDIDYLLQQIEIKDKALKEIHKRIEYLANQPIAVFGEGFGWEEHYKWLKRDLRVLFNNLPKGEDTP
ncbi:hypothetical protein QNH38_08015 [Paenibacillus polymyxa]|uniref:hypothetical protein n=1 Tax=Paenibacillus polymyxa TaxID=1406 RepID=UPI0024C06B80|nr:hypothetical protein [Paenibacillus polymyxa]WHX37376.1 hypothetical protein QNH38_08015 [Paenibacillus polymyxa]